uniref:Uncharacterized protein n=1 Tax=Rangifer tarandus platyrhynchus TaxID=3082113 RepID=A0ACB0DPS7_RANTA|nr:unnamed protein product [Rangifer tarandus platyrhynchus]
MPGEGLPPACFHRPEREEGDGLRTPSRRGPDAPQGVRGGGRRAQETPDSCDQRPHLAIPGALRLVQQPRVDVLPPVLPGSCALLPARKPPSQGPAECDTGGHGPAPLRPQIVPRLAENSPPCRHCAVISISAFVMHAFPQVLTWPRQRRLATAPRRGFATADGRCHRWAGLPGAVRAPRGCPGSGGP